MFWGARRHLKKTWKWYCVLFCMHSNRQVRVKWKGPAVSVVHKNVFKKETCMNDNVLIILWIAFFFSFCRRHFLLIIYMQPAHRFINEAPSCFSKLASSLTTRPLPNSSPYFFHCGYSTFRFSSHLSLSIKHANDQRGIWRCIFKL